MTCKSICDQSKSIVPDRTNEVTPERRAFEYELYGAHDKLVQSWVRRLIPETLRETIDVEQLKLMIILELIERLRNRVNEVHIDRSETIPLCWTITHHQAKNAVRDVRSLKRVGLSEFIEIETIGDLHDKKESDRPDRIAETNDLLSVISDCLEPQNRSVLEHMNLGFAYLEIAGKLGVTTKVLDGMRKVITDTTRRILDRSDQPSAISHQPSAISHQKETPELTS